MRRLFAGSLAAVALFASAACGGGGDAKDKNADAVTDGAGALSKLAAGSAANVCGGRAAVGIGMAFASAMSKTDTNYTDVANALDKAADAAPSEIKDDFRVIAEAEGPFLKVLAKTDFSDYMALSSNQEYLDAIKALDTEEFKTASANVNSWFDEHC